MSKTYALIGGNSGIGLATAQRLVAAGHHVTAACFPPRCTIF
jgi:NAD(P)-dependent dehydrogenase (short-subunit alcohol dehydrogenase family)